MKVIKTISRMQSIAKKIKAENKSIGFVPTMGYLHQGHLSLLNKSVRDCDVSVVSIYVNPTQFGPKEDFKKYPRNIKRDLQLCRDNNADYVFLPQDKDIYPEGYKTEVRVKGLTEFLCGRSRPGHFNGVTTIVNKLFNIVLPDIAYFGQKDAQQALIIKKMAADLHMPLKIKVLPIVREADGLAMSSRNSYLDGAERQDAVILSKALKKAAELIRQGNRNGAEIIGQMKRLISQSVFAKIDYIAIVDSERLEAVKSLKKNTSVLIALAVYISKVRLIDNMIIKIN